MHTQVFHFLPGINEQGLMLGRSLSHALPLIVSKFKFQPDGTSRLSRQMESKQLVHIQYSSWNFTVTGVTVSGEACSSRSQFKRAARAAVWRSFLL